MLGFMPSEIARLVLGYLQETDCQQAKMHFLNECRHLQEYSECLEKGLHYPTTIDGRGLQTMLQDYYLLTHLDPGTSFESQLLVSSMEGAVSQVKYLLNDYKTLVNCKKNSPTKVVKVSRPTLKAFKNGKSASSFTRLKQKRYLQCHKKTEIKIKETGPSSSQPVQNDPSFGSSSATDSNPVLQTPLSAISNRLDSSSNGEQLPIHKFSQDPKPSRCFSTEHFNLALAKNSCASTTTRDSCTSPLHVNISLDNGSRLTEIQKHAGSTSGPSRTNNNNLNYSTTENPDCYMAASQPWESQTKRNQSTSPYSPMIQHNVHVFRGAEQSESGAKNISSVQISSRDDLLTKREAHSFRVPFLHDSQHIKNSLVISKNMSPVKTMLKAVLKKNEKLLVPYSHSISGGDDVDGSTIPEDSHVENMRLSYDRDEGVEPEIPSSPGESSECNSPLNLACERDQVESPTVCSNRESAKDILIIDLDSSQSSFVETPKKHFLGVRSQAIAAEKECSESKSESTGGPTTGITNTPCKSAATAGNVLNSLEISQEAEEAWNQITIQKERIRNFELCTGFSPSSQKKITSDSNRLRRSPRISSKSLKSAESSASSPYRKTPNHDSSAVNSPSTSLQSPPIITPLNSVEPDLPDRFPDRSSPRYALSQQRSEFLVPSMTTPVKQYHQAIKDQQGFSPKRKSQIPRRRIMSSPSVRSLLQSPSTKTVDPNILSPFKTSDGFMDFEFLEELINYPPFVEKLAENINRVKGNDSNARPTSEDHEPVSSETSDNRIPEVHIPETIVKDILNHTESDPLFEDVLNMLCDKHDQKRDTEVYLDSDNLNESLNNTISMDCSPASHTLQSPEYPTPSSTPIKSVPPTRPLPTMPRTTNSSTSVSNSSQNTARTIRDAMDMSLVSLSSAVTSPRRNLVTLSNPTTVTNAPIVTNPTSNFAIIPASTTATESTCTMVVANSTSFFESIAPLSNSALNPNASVTMNPTSKFMTITLPASSSGASASGASGVINTTPKLTTIAPINTSTLITNSALTPVPVLLPKAVTDCVVASVPNPSNLAFKYPSPKKDLLQRTLESLDFELSPIKAISIEAAGNATPAPALTSSNSSGTCIQVLGQPITTTVPSSTITANGEPLKLILQNGVNVLTFSPGKFYTQAMSDIFLNQGNISVQQRPNQSRTGLKKVTLAGVGQCSRITASKRKKIETFMGTNSSRKIMRTCSSKASPAKQSVRLHSHIRTLDFGQNPPDEWPIPLAVELPRQNSEPSCSSNQVLHSSPGPSSGVVYVNAFGQKDTLSTINLSELDLIRDSNSSSSPGTHIKSPVKKSTAKPSGKKKQKIESSTKKQSPPKINCKVIAKHKPRRKSPRKNIALKIKWDYTRKKREEEDVAKSIKNRTASGNNNLVTPTKVKTCVVSETKKAETSQKIKNTSASKKTKPVSCQKVKKGSTTESNGPSSQELLKEMDIDRFLSSVYKEQ